MRVIDVSNPFSPLEIGSYPTFGDPEDVAISGNFAYVADYDSGLQVVNVAIPSNPVGLGLCHTAGHNRGVAVAGNYAYVAYYDLAVINISNPTSPFSSRLLQYPRICPESGGFWQLCLCG